MSTRSSFNIGKAANILFTAGLIGSVALLFLWFVSMPGGPGAAMEGQGSSTVMAVYAQCLYDSAFYVSWPSCPLGGKIYLLVWASVGILLLGLLLKASSKSA